jgi:wobble nucleotide-excising tRNase
MKNLQFILKSAISALQVTYKDYKAAIIEDLRCSWYSDDGEFAFLAGAEERKKKIEDLEKEVTRLHFEVDKIKNEIEADKEESGGER